MKNEELRASVRTLYDMQKLRIQSGNRIAAAFRVKVGLDSSQAEKEDKNANKILDDLRREYKRITDGIKRITKNTKIKNAQLITSIGEVRLIESYEHQLKAEHIHEQMLQEYLNDQAIFTQFLDDVKGCGTKMSAVILSEIDIEKCNSISALWKYCGLDVVVKTDKETGEIKEEGRCRKAHHLEKKTYKNSDGETVETVGITFNPFLKTKLIGVLGSCLMKTGGSYKEIYDNYKYRLENHPKHSEKTKGHRHNMAVRYMVKEFLADLWTNWRKLEQLPVRSRYSEEKLGITHSKAA